MYEVKQVLFNLLVCSNTWGMNGICLATRVTKTTITSFLSSRTRRFPARIVPLTGVHAILSLEYLYRVARALVSGVGENRDRKSISPALQLPRRGGLSSGGG